MKTEERKKQKENERKVGNVVVADPADYDAVRKEFFFDFEEIRESMNKILVDNGLKGLYSVFCEWDKKQNTPILYVVLDKNSPYVSSGNGDNGANNQMANILKEKVNFDIIADTGELEEILRGAFVPLNGPVQVKTKLDYPVIEIDLECSLTTVFGMDGESEFIKVKSAMPKTVNGKVQGVIITAEAIDVEALKKVESFVDYQNNHNRNKSDFNLSHIVRSSKYSGRRR